MKKILLVCSAGMSTSLMVAKMKEAAEASGETIRIMASAEADLEENLEGVNLVLLGPQVRYLEAKLRSRVPAEVPVRVIDSVDYGTMNGVKVLAGAMAEIKGREG